MRRWLAWNVWFRLQETAKGHETFRILAEMERADRLSVSQLQELQRDRLSSFIASCFEHVPYVRRMMQDAGVTPEAICAPSDLSRLPLMTKRDVRSHRQALKADNARHLSPFTTGGSTGEPLIFDLGKRRIASRVACRQRVTRWWGLSLGHPEIALWGSPIELTRQDRLRGLRDRLLASRLLSAFEMNDETMSRYLDILETGQWRQIFAYPTAIYLLCLHARKTGRDLRKAGLKVVFVTSEVLFPYQREIISDTLGCPVANGYGGRDSGFIAHECPQGGMHLMADAVVTEIVDERGRPVPAGEPGQIVVTDLYSHEAPFIRYVTGDVGAVSARRCPCGRPLPLLERLEGRSNSAVVTSDGRIMHGQSLVARVMDVEGIEQFHIHQQRVDRFHVQIVPNVNYRRDVGEQRIRGGWQQLLRTPIEVTFEYVSKIEPDPRGKFRHIVSDVAASGRVEEQVVERSA
jgi:phenylacetate-CoA ligase